MHSAKSEIDRELQLMELRATMEERKKKFLAEAEALGMHENSILNPDRPVASDPPKDEEKRDSD
ncbi:MAG: hypothetical protein RLZZ627_570 [Pseudomonadota bacterium]